MIDFHSHIIPEVDDGARNIEETIKLIKEASEAGFNGIISTSHYIEGYYESDVLSRRKWLDIINEKLTNVENIQMDLYIGNEAYYSEHVKEFIDSNKVTTINDTKYLLFEFPLNNKPRNIKDFLYDLMDGDFIPILAHPERYSFVQESPSIINELIDMGVLMQANYASILGQYGKKAKSTVKKLLRCNAIHFLGSDVHRKDTIYPQVNSAIVEIEKIVGKDKVKELTETNPKLVLENKTIIYEEPATINRSFMDKFF